MADHRRLRWVEKENVMKRIEELRLDEHSLSKQSKGGKKRIKFCDLLFLFLDLHRLMPFTQEERSDVKGWKRESLGLKEATLMIARMDKCIITLQREKKICEIVMKWKKKDLLLSIIGYHGGLIWLLWIWYFYVCCYKIDLFSLQLCLARTAQTFNRKSSFTLDFDLDNGIYPSQA